MLRLFLTLLVLGIILDRCNADWPSGVYMLPNQTVPVYALVQSGNIYQVSTTLTFQVGANYSLVYGSSLFSVQTTTGFVSLSATLASSPTSYQLVVQVNDGANLRAYAPLSVVVLSLTSSPPMFTNLPNYPVTGFMSMVSSSALAGTLLYTLSGQQLGSSQYTNATSLVYSNVPGGYTPQRFSVSASGQVRTMASYFGTSSPQSFSIGMSVTGVNSNTTYPNSSASNPMLVYVAAQSPIQFAVTPFFYFKVFERSIPGLLIGTVNAFVYNIPNTTSSLSALTTSSLSTSVLNGVPSTVQSGVLSYSLTPSNVPANNASTRFGTGPQNIYSQLSLVYTDERTRLIKFTATASASSSVASSAWQTTSSGTVSASVGVMVELLDVNDHGPMFEQSLYVAQAVSVNTATGTIVLSIPVYELDAGLNAMVQFSIVSTTTSISNVPFSVQTQQLGPGGVPGVTTPMANYSYVPGLCGNTAVANIVVSGNLFYEVTAQHAYTFQLIATDFGVPPQSSSASVVIMLANANRYPPVFVNRSPIIFYENANSYLNPSIYLPSSTGVTAPTSGQQPIGQVQAIDPDGCLVTYSFLVNSLSVNIAQTYFYISTTGLIYLMSAPPDSGSTHMWTLTVLAQDNGQCHNCPACTIGSCVTQNASTTVIVKQMQLVNNRPIITTCPSVVSVSELQGSGLTVSTIVASDTDWNDNGLLTYSLVQPSFSSPAFTISPQSGIVSTLRSLDLASDPTYIYLTVFVRDAGISGSLNTFCVFRVVITDINNNMPTFDLPTGVSGVTPVNFIPFNSPSNTQVARLFAYDPDQGINGQVIYSLVSVQVSQQVGVNTQTYNLQNVLAINSSTGWVSTIVTNLTSAMLSTGAQYPSGGIAYVQVAVQAANPASATFYSVLSAGSAAQPVTNPNWPTITFTLALIDNVVAFPNFVQASWTSLVDGAVISLFENAAVGSTIYSINGTSNCPAVVTSCPTFGINLVSGMTVVSNRQNSQRFASNGFNTASIRTTGTLSYLLVPTYWLQMVGSPVISQSAPNAATVNGYVQVNLAEANIQTPQFYGADSRSIYSVNVTERTLAGTPLMTAVALIQSNNSAFTQMTYSTVSSGSSSPNGFSLAPTTGILTSTFTLQRAASPAPPYYFLISAYNGNVNQQSATASVSISVLNLNLNAATFNPTSATVTVAINLALNNTVYTLSATNVDGNDPLEYAIISGNLQGAFSVQPDSGVIVLARGLDQVTTLAGITSATATFLFTTLGCQVNTGRFVSNFTLSVFVQPTNIYPPSFTSTNVSVTGVQAGSSPLTLTTLTATPYSGSVNGLSLTFSIVSGTTSSYFSITSSSNSAQLSLASPLSRDVPYGRQNWLVLVAASDSGSPLAPAQTAYCQVTVQVTSGPVFTPVLNPFQNATLYELMSGGTSVTFNFGSSLQTVYNLPSVSGVPQPFFSLAASSNFAIDAGGVGLLSSTTQFNYQNVITQYPWGLIPVPVQITMAGASNTQTATFTVQIVDVNNNPPSFLSAPSSITVADGTPIGTVVYSVQATDLDIVDQGALSFTMTPSSPYFSLTTYAVTNTAVLTVSSTINFDSPGFPRSTMPFVYTIAVIDTQPAISSLQRNTVRTTVSVTVVDANTQVPVFTPGAAQSVTLPDSTQIGTAFASFSVTDGDYSSPNNNLQVVINRTTDPFGFFTLQATSPTVTSSSGTPYSTNGQLGFSVVVNKNLTQLRLQTLQAGTTNPVIGTGFVNLTLVATDNGVPQLVQTTNLLITLQPSSSGPQFLFPYSPVVTENQAASSTSPLLAYLPGRANSSMLAFNGAGSYSFTLLTASGNVQSLFTLCCTSTGGYGSTATGVSMQLYATSTLSRQQQTSYALPIRIVDLLTSGQPSSTATLTVTVGDVDNNPPGAATKNMIMNIFSGAYRYSASSGYYAGYVWNNDSDWWDRGMGNYRFSFVSPPSASLFSLDTVSGNLTVLGAGAGSYTLQFNVQDMGYQGGQVTVVSTVQLQINILTLDAFAQYGSVRIGGLTPLQFISLMPSTGSSSYSGNTLMQSFIAQLAQSFSTTVSNVYILNVYPSSNGNQADVTMQPAIDVLYGVSGSPFHYNTVLNAGFQQNLPAFNTLLNAYQSGAYVVSAPIDLCATVPVPCGGAYPLGTCATVMDASFLSNSPQFAPYTYTFNANSTQYPWTNMVETNATAVSFINARLRRSCQSCPSQQFNAVGGCSPDRCNFHGTCSVISPASSAYSCSCSASQFDGPRCQQTKHTFSGSGAYAWYAPLVDCSNLTISFSFATSQSSAMLFYSGPFNQQIGVTGDFLSVFLSNNGGQTTLTLVAFFGDLTYALQITPSYTVTDSNWHRVDIYRDQQTIRFVLDQCANVSPLPNEPSNVIANYAGCAAVYTIAYGNAWTLDVQSWPIQLGGLYSASYPTAISSINTVSQALGSLGGLNGCMKNLRINGVLYDLYIGTLGQHANDADGCARESCSACPGSSTCVNTIDQPSSSPQCYCKSGFKQACNVSSTLGDYQNQSITAGTFTQYSLSVPSTVPSSALLSTFTLFIEFITTQSSGVLFAAYGQQTVSVVSWKRFILRIVSGTLSLQYNLGSSSVDQWLVLSSVNVSDGVLHNVTLTRSFNMFELMLDDGDGVRYNITFGGPADTYYYLAVNQAVVLCGAPLGYAGQPYASGDQYIGCLSDVRFYFLPSTQGIYQQFPYLPATLNSDPESLAGSITASNQVASGCANTSAGAPLCGTSTAPSCTAPYVCTNTWRSAVCACPSTTFLNVGTGTPSCQPANLCLSNPCQNGATCQSGSSSNYTCLCAAGYSGTQCQTSSLGGQAVLASEGIITVAVCAAVAAIILIACLIALALKASQPAERDPETLGVVNPSYDTRENVRDDAEEQEGAEPIDSHQFDMDMINAEIRKLKSGGDAPPYAVPHQPLIDTPDNQPQLGAPPNVYSDLPPSAASGDEHIPYAHEGASSDVGTLSSLASVDTDASLDFHSQFRQLGPQFDPLADLYKNP